MNLVNLNNLLIYLTVNEKMFCLSCSWGSVELCEESEDSFKHSFPFQHILRLIIKASQLIFKYANILFVQ